MTDDLLTQYIEALKKAEEIGALMVSRSSTASRENSLSFTNLQQAILWAEAGR